MDVFESKDLNQKLVNELVDDVNKHYLISEKALIDLDRNPDNPELLAELFRSIHTLKGNFGVVSFAPAIPLVHAIEEVMSVLRQGDIPYSPMISDLILLVLDLVRGYVNRYSEEGYIQYESSWVAELSQKITALTLCKSEDIRQHQIADAIRLLDPTVIVDEEHGVDGGSLHDDSFLQTLGFDADIDEDVQFFRALMEPVEDRSRYWHGRGDRILKMAMILNQIGGSPVDSQQLAVAVYVHDFGMAFMPLALLHKKDTLYDDEILLLRSHVQSSSHLLQNMDQWREAKEIVMQHHEMVDGAGYPYGLRENEICDGAKILAIADTFDALTHHRAYSDHQKRPIIRAVREINQCSGKQLSPHWVEIFNKAVEPVLSAHRLK